MAKILPFSWNRCLICTSSVEWTSSKRESEDLDNDTNNNQPRLTGKRILFLKYLLGVPTYESQKEESLINAVTQLLSSSCNESKLRLKFCNNCENKAEEVTALHLTMETAQMQMLNVLQNIKNMCQWVENNNEFQNDVANFKKLLYHSLNDGNGEVKVHNHERFLDILTKVHSLVSRTDISRKTVFASYRSPAVVLEKCGLHQKKDTCSNNATNGLVKEEQEDLIDNESYDRSDNFFHFDDDDGPVSEDNDKEINDDVKVNSEPVIEKKRKRKTKMHYSKHTHKKSHVSPFTCSVCSKIFKVKAKLLKHLRKFHKDITKLAVHLKTSEQHDSEESSAKNTSENIRTETEQLLLNMKANEDLKEIFLSLKKENFNCLNCKFSTDVAAKMDQHLRTHETSTKAFHCPDSNCNRSFTQKQHFVFHLQQHCTRNRKCLRCNENLPVLQMEEHLKTHFERLFPCESCDLKFGNFPDLVHHNRFHPRVELKCQLCTTPNLFRRRIDIRKHLYEHHNIKELLLKCDYPGCTETFFDPHKKIIHANVHKKQYMCQICSKAFTGYSTLASHIFTAHKRQKHLLKNIKAAQRQRGCEKRSPSTVSERTEAEKMLLQIEAAEPSKELFKSLKNDAFACVICGYKAQKTWQIEQHFREHETNEKFYHCPEHLVCNKSFTNKQIFIFHLQNHFARKRKCDSCDKQLPVLEMTEHLKTHHERVFTCQLCDFSVGNFKDLLWHGKYHSNADLVCQLCSENEIDFKQYSTRQQLLEHLYNHHKMEDLLIKCDHPDCTETFLDPLAKKYHSVKVHKMSKKTKIHKSMKTSLKSRPTRKKRELEKNKTVVVTADSPSEYSESERLLLNMEVEESSFEIFQSIRSNACVMCQFKTHRSFVMDHHLREHEAEQEEKTFHCPVANCNRSFVYKQSFVFHLQQHSTRKIKCTWCEESVAILRMEDHLKTHCDQIYFCQLCDYRFGRFKDFVAHGRYHKKADVKCQLCTDSELAPQTYPSHAALVQHMYEYHDKKEGLLKCYYPDCDKTFFDLGQKQRHENKHGDDGLYECNDCKKSYSSSKALAVHLKIHAGRKDVLLCDLCPERFKTRALLDAHKITVHGMQALKCQFCVDVNKEFATKVGLDAHIKIFHQRKRWICSICGKELRTKFNWIRHEQSHSEEKNFVCSNRECCYATNTLASLKRHEKLHGEKTYKCNYCTKAFAIKRYLDEHILTHTKEHPFVCDVCGKRFNQRFSLSSHKKKQHGFNRGNVE